MSLPCSHTQLVSVLVYGVCSTLYAYSIQSIRMYSQDDPVHFSPDCHKRKVSTGYAPTDHIEYTELKRPGKNVSGALLDR